MATTWPRVTSRHNPFVRGLQRVCVLVLAMLSAVPLWADEPRVATFRCDVTPPLGQPMFNCDAIRTVEQPLLAKGIVLEAEGQRYVLCAIDWCELCNGSYDSIRTRIAEAADTDASHVALQTIHQHTAPLVDMDSRKLLAEAGFPHGIHIDPEVYTDIEQRLVAAVKQSRDRLAPFDRIGVGQAKVDRVASCRRAVDATGKIQVRWSSCDDPAVQALPEGTIDPYLKTITLARGVKPLVRLHYYATHPQSKYGDGRATSDVPGIAREKLQNKEGVFQIYFTGCGGDITFGKYNTGSKKDREDLSSRLLAGMEASVAATKLGPVGDIRWRICPVVFPRRTDSGFSLDDSLARMKDSKSEPTSKFYAGSLRAAFHHRSGTPIELTSLQLGNVHIVHLPGEPMLDFQFFAQGLKPTDFVAVAGYGDCGIGYLCPEKAFAEGGYEPTDSNVKPESEALVKKAIRALLGVD